MKFDRAQTVDQLVWQMRLADLPRGENRAILDRLYNGDPPYDEAEAEENNVQVNRNDLKGVNALAQARRQWIQAFLKPGNFFSVSLDAPTNPTRRREWSHAITESANTVLRTSRQYIEQSRAVGGMTILHGIGPSAWRTRRSVIPRELPISSLMVPSETGLDLDDSTPYLAIFQEMTPAQLYGLTHGPRVDPGWNMPLVQDQLRYVAEQVLKQPNATAFQYMPERIERLVKQDLGLWGSDAVPTVDFWDFYFKKESDGPVYRRVILDWGLSESDLHQYKGWKTGDKVPDKKVKGKQKDDWGGFLYTSGNRKFADSFAEVVHCQFGDCSAVFPQTYHGTRSAGWMLWGICDLENRLHCKFNEALFLDLMWLFQVANDEQLTRLQRVDLAHLGVIPPGVRWLTSQERYTPDEKLVAMGFSRLQQLMAENASSFTQDFERSAGQKEMTATETMARVNSVNALVSGMLTLAYTYEEFKDREIMRRLCIPNNPDPLAKRFLKLCLQKGVPTKMLDIDRMSISRERVMGGGNKTLEMAQVQFLQGIRKNLGPDAQRKVDHISIESATDDANLAEDLAPTEIQKPISHSTQDAQLATDRLMRGLPFPERPDMIYEDYVQAWLADLQIMVTKYQQGGGMAPANEIAGFQNMIQQIGAYLKIMSSDPEEKEKVRLYETKLSQLGNLVKAFASRLVSAMKAQQGNGAGPDPKDAAKAQAMVTQAQTKAKLSEQSHAQKTAQRQIAFELEQQRKDREHAAEMRRLGQEHAYEMFAGHAERHAAVADRPVQPEQTETE